MTKTKKKTSNVRKTGLKTKFTSKKLKSNKKTPSNDAKVKNAIKKINVLILGPGYPKNELTQRINIKNHLIKLGINARVMEEVKPAARQITHLDKFAELLEMKNLLCIAISTKEGYSLGLTFEIGFISGLFSLKKDGKKRLQQELAFLIDKKANRKRILSSYVTSGLFVDGITMQHTYSSRSELIKMIHTWTKSRAQKIGLF